MSSKPNTVSTQVQAEHALSYVEDAVRTFAGIQQLADVIAKMESAPAHLRGKPNDCFRIVVQAAKWKMDPFAVAECTSLVHGRLCYEGKLVAAVLQAMGAIEDRLHYEITGTGQAASIKVSGRPRGHKGPPLELTGSVKDWRTVGKGKDGQPMKNAWDTMPETMLVYRGTRQWARIYAPEALLGVYTPDEFEEVRETEAFVHNDPPPARTGTPAAPPVEEPAAQGKPEDPPPAAGKPTAGKPKEEPAHLVRARDFYRAANQHAEGLGKKLTDALCTLHKATAPKDLPSDHVEQFKKDLDELSKDFATAETTLAEWIRQEETNK